MIDAGEGLFVAMSLAQRFMYVFKSSVSEGAHFKKIEIVNLLLRSLYLPCADLMGAE